MELILIGFAAGVALTWTVGSFLRTPKTPAPVETDLTPDCIHLWGKWELHKHGPLVRNKNENVGFYETRRRVCELCNDFEFKTLKNKP